MSNLKFYRQSRGLSQEQLAVRAGITVRYIAFLESGQKKPSLTLAFKISRILQASIEDIFLPIRCTNCTQGNSD